MSSSVFVCADVRPDAGWARRHPRRVRRPPPGQLEAGGADGLADDVHQRARGQLRQVTGERKQSIVLRRHRISSGRAPSARTNLPGRSTCSAMAWPALASRTTGGVRTDRLWMPRCRRAPRPPAGVRRRTSSAGRAPAASTTIARLVLPVSVTSVAGPTRSGSEDRIFRLACTGAASTTRSAPRMPSRRVLTCVSAPS